MTQAERDLAASLEGVDPSAPSTSGLKPMAEVFAGYLGVPAALVYPISVSKLGNLTKQAEQSARARDARVLVVLVRDDQLGEGAIKLTRGLVAQEDFDAALVVVHEIGRETRLVGIVQGEGVAAGDGLVDAFPTATRAIVRPLAVDMAPGPGSADVEPAVSLPDVAFTKADCALFERTLPGTPWSALSEADIELGRDIRERLKTLATAVARAYTGAAELTPHTSLHNQSGHPAQDLWCCAYPEAAGNKSYTLQVALIVSARGAELCLCLGAGASSISDPEEKRRLEAELRRVQISLGSTPTDDRSRLAEELAGWDLRRSWREVPGAGGLDSIDEWLAHAAGPEGAASSISRFLDPDELEGVGSEIGKDLLQLANISRRLFDRAYADVEDDRSGRPPASSFDVESVMEMVSRLRIEETVVANVVAALNSGKHVVLTGPPGTGKTTLAEGVAKAAARARRCRGYVLTTATSDWTTYETIGGLEPVPEGGLRFRPGHFIEAVSSERWLVVDELNRSNFDRALGQLFTVLSGQSVVLPYRDPDSGRRIALVSEGDDPPDEAEPISVPESWRLIATMNVFDKALLFEMSYALMRRLAFIEVTEPAEPDYEALIDREVGGDTRAADLTKQLLVLRTLIRIGPAVFLDIARFVAARQALGGVGDENLLFDAFYGLLLPQFEGIDDVTGQALETTLAPMVGASNRPRLRASLKEVLGVELPDPPDMPTDLEETNAEEPEDLAEPSVDT